MKTIFLRGCSLFTPVAILLALGLGCRTASERGASLPSTVVRVRGEARYAPAGGTNWITLKRGGLLETGAVVQTAGDSLVDVALGERPWVRFQEQPLLRYETKHVVRSTRPLDVIRLDSDSVVRFDSVVLGGSVISPRRVARFTLRSGRVYCAVGHTDCEIKFKSGGVRLQEPGFFSVTDVGLVSVHTGQVAVTAAETGLTTEVKEGYEFDLRTGTLLPIPVDVKSAVGVLH